VLDARGRHREAAREKKEGNVAVFAEEKARLANNATFGPDSMSGGFDWRARVGPIIDARGRQ
jgi:hypothetical protein